MRKSSITFTAIGDCCIDTYPKKQQAFLGGTAFNVVYAAQLAGATTTLISSVGEDAYGEKYLTVCNKQQINTAFLTVRSGKTSHVDILFDDKKSPIFANWDIGVLKNRRLSEAEKRFITTQDIVRAVLYKPFRAMFHTFSELYLPHTLKVADFLGASLYSYRTNPIKMYASHFDIFFKSIEGEEHNLLSFLQAIAKDYDKIVVALLGKKGSIVFTKDATYTQPAIKTVVVNTIGAGDTYQAYFCYWYKKTNNIPKAMEEATKAAALTVAQMAASYPKQI